jgi:hypothetical protein
MLSDLLTKMSTMTPCFMNEVHTSELIKYYSGDQIKENGMGGGMWHVNLLLQSYSLMIFH